LQLLLKTKHKKGKQAFKKKKKQEQKKGVFEVLKKEKKQTRIHFFLKTLD